MGRKRKLEGGGGGDATAPSPSRSSRRRSRGGGAAEDKQSNGDDTAADRRRTVGEEDGGNSSRIVTRETNPLLNDLILQNLFSHMSVELLATSRLVCRLWNDASLSSWRGSAAPRISRCLKGPGNDRPRPTIPEFMKFAKANCDIKPYRQFRLEHWELKETGLGTFYSTRFWNLHGHQITKLTLENCRSLDTETVFKTINKFCPNLEALVLSSCRFGELAAWQAKLREGPQYKVPLHGEHPNLKSLHISSSGGNFVGAHCRLTYLELLTHFPNLTTFNLEGGCWYRSPSASEVLKFLRVVELIRRQDPRKLPITKLAGFVVVVDELTPRVQGQPPALAITDLLHELKLPPLPFRLTDKLRSPTEIQNFVGFCGDGVRNLEVDWRSPSQSRCNFPFGVELPNLEHLRMPEGFCLNFDFLKYAPNLKSLLIWADYRRRCTTPILMGARTSLIESTSKSGLANTELLKLTTLKLEHFTVGVEDLRWLVKWMPHVKNLTMSLNDEQFPIVCENWHDLVQIKVVGGGLTDEGVTGMKNIGRPGMTTDDEQEEEEEEWEASPNITCLQNLGVFSAPNATLCEISLVHGFLKMRRLRQIFFRNPEVIGDKMREALLQKGIEVSEID